MLLRIETTVHPVTLREHPTLAHDVHGIAFVAQPEDIAAQTAKMERRANAGDKAKQAKIRDMKVRGQNLRDHHLPAISLPRQPRLSGPCSGDFESERHRRCED
eukprot:COSAG02_NODE_13379_length_1401_cov_19.588667_3_plen_103_part_00